VRSREAAFERQHTHHPFSNQPHSTASYSALPGVLPWGPAVRQSPTHENLPACDGLRVGSRRRRPAERVWRGSRLQGRSLLAQAAAQPLDHRRRRGRRRGQARSHLDRASPVHAPAKRNTIDLESGAAGPRIRRRRHAGVVVGRARPGLRVAAARARHLPRLQRQRVARRRRGQGRAHPEVHARGQVPDADREAGSGPGQQRHGRPPIFSWTNRPTKFTSPTAT
jgi:hypothetical protein